MDQHFMAQIVDEADGIVTVQVGFGSPATNVEIVPEAVSALAALGLKGGRGIRFTGPVSIPAAMALAHAVEGLGWPIRKGAIETLY